MILYTKTVCPKCMLIKSTLDATGLECDVVNIDENEEAKDLIVSKGFMSVPIIEVDGEFHGEIHQIQAKIYELAN